MWDCLQFRPHTGSRVCRQKCSAGFRHTTQFPYFPRCPPTFLAKDLGSSRSMLDCREASCVGGFGLPGEFPSPSFRLPALGDGMMEATGGSGEATEAWKSSVCCCRVVGGTCMT